jgi:hypothetical protein
VVKVKTTISKPKPRTDTVKLKSLGIRSADGDNLYFQRCEDISNDSGTTKACIKLKSKYIGGAGFVDPNLGSIVLNRKGLTVNKLRAKIAWALCQHGGAMIHFNYNGLGQKTEINYIPFPFGRLTLEESKFANRVAIYDNWDALTDPIKKEDVKYIHKYDKFKVFEQVEAEEVKIKSTDEMEILAAKFEKYQGQVMYWTPDGDDKYPLCPYDEVLEDCITEAQTKRFKSSTSSRNFMPSHYVVTGPDEVEEDENGKPIEGQGGGMGEVFKQFQGSEEAAQIIHIQKTGEEEPFEIHKIEIQQYDKLLEHTEDSATEDIVRAFNIPDILLLRRDGGLGGNGAELYEARTYLNETTQQERDIVSMIIEECFDGFVKNSGIEDFGIKSLRHEKPIAATDLTSIMAVVKDQELSRDQKREMLSIVYDLNEERINKLLGQ